MVRDKIKHFRELRNYSKEWLADELGISKSQLCKLEDGTCKIDVERLLEIAKILNICVIDFFDAETLQLSKIYNADNYGIIESAYMRNLTHQIDFLERRCGFYESIIRQQNLNVSTQLTQFKRLIDHLSKSENTQCSKE